MNVALASLTHSHSPVLPSARRCLVALALAVFSATMVGPIAATATAPFGLSSDTTTPPTASATSPTTERSTLVLVPEESTYTSSRKPGRPMGAARQLVVSAGQEAVYLKFDGSRLEGRRLISAKLRLAVRHTGGGNARLVAHPTSGSWSQETLTHKNRPKQLNKALNSKSPKLRNGMWVNLKLNKARSLLSKGKLAFRLSLSSGSAKTVLGKSRKFAPQLILNTERLGGVDSPNDEDKVFAHYFPPYPISIDNKPPASDYYQVNYMTINGEGGKHKAYGGLLRDRPMGRAPLPGNWKMTDLRTEVQQAKAAGIDGFTVNILDLTSRNWAVCLELMEAADEVGGFEIVPTLDAASAPAVSLSPADTAAKLATLYEHVSAQMIGDEYVLASFLAENKAPEWWESVIDHLEDDHALPMKFIAVFNSPTAQNFAAFAPFSYALSFWGYRNAPMAAAAPSYAARAHALGVKWMSTVAFQDARPRSGTYAEAGNTETARTTWMRAIQDGADFVQIATWNDYSETTSVAPSMAHGSVFLAINRFYQDWFTAGTAPSITADHLYLTHRIHPWNATPTSGIKNMSPSLGGSKVAPRDTVEALVFLTAPALVSVTSGTNNTTVQLPAGVSTVLIPLGTGQSSARIARGSSVVKSVTSPYSVTLTPQVQDLQYYASGS